MIKFIKAIVLCTILGIFIYCPVVNAASYVLLQGKSVEIRNTTSSSINVNTTGKVDYASYNLTGSGLSTKKDNTSSFGISTNYRTVVTNSGSSSVTLSSTSSAFAPTEVTTPALMSGTMEANKTYEFDSNLSSAVTVYNNCSATTPLDFVCYNNDGTIPSTNGSGRNSSTLTSIVIPIGGKAVFSAQDRNITYWCAYDVYQKFMTVTERENPAFVKGTFKFGKNYKLESLYSKEVTINSDSTTDLTCDYANYSNDGKVDYDANVKTSEIKIPVKGTTYITPNTANINYWYPYDYGIFVIVTETEKPALYKGTIPVGTSYEFDSSYIRTIDVTNENKTNYDFASYSPDGNVNYKRNINDTLISIPIAGATVITAVGSDLSYNIPFEFYSNYIIASSSQSPALFIGTLELGKNYKFSNSFINDAVITNDSSAVLIYDYATYSKDDSTVFGNNDKYLDITVKEHGTTDITPMTDDVNFWYPYKYFTKYITLITKDTPALKRGIIKANSSTEIISNCFSDIKIFTNASSTLLFDFASYNSDGTMASSKYTYTYKSDASDTNVILPKRGKIVFSALTSSLRYYLPYDLDMPYLTINENSNPALFKGVIKINENYEFKSKYLENIILTTDGRSAAYLDIASYKFDNSVVFNHNYFVTDSVTTATIFPNGRTVISAITGDNKFWMPYEIYTKYITASKIDRRALYVGGLEKDKNYVFTNKDINVADIADDCSEASLNDYVIYSNNETCTFFDNNKTTTKITVNPNGMTTISVYGKTNFWYPNDIFTKYITVVEQDTPALSILKLAPGKTYEFTNAKDISIKIKNDAISKTSVVFDYTIYNSDGTVAMSESSSTGTSSNYITLAPGTRVIVTVNAVSQREIEFCGAYGTFTNNGKFPSGEAPVEYAEGFIIQKVTSLPTSDISLTANADILNNSSLPNSATVIFALYNPDKVLIKSYIVEKDFYPNQTISTGCTFQNVDILSGYIVKVYVWSDTNNNIPLCEPKSDIHI